MAFILQYWCFLRVWLYHTYLALLMFVLSVIEQCFVTMTSKRSVTESQTDTDWLYVLHDMHVFFFLLFWLDLIICRPWVQIALTVSRSTCNWGNTFFHCVVCGCAGNVQENAQEINLSQFTCCDMEMTWQYCWGQTG